jgi:mannosylglycerate hydrolase
MEKIYHVVPITHWDREWYLSFEEYRVNLIHVLDELLLTLENNEYRHFLLDGQTSAIDDYLEIRPENKEKLITLIRTGRLCIGPWYILPDEFLVSGESTIQNLILGRKMANELGGSMDIGYLPDSFCHIAQMPQILKGFGISDAVMWRGYGGEEGQDSSTFLWQAPNGDKVLTEHLPREGYGSNPINTVDDQKLREQFEQQKKDTDYRAQTPNRLWTSGSDHYGPYPKLPEAISKLNKMEGGRSVIHSSLPEFFNDLKKSLDINSLPIVKGELRFGYLWGFNLTGGIYSSRTYIKIENWRMQSFLERYVDPINALTNGKSQKALIQMGWKMLMQNHPHDSICGCSIDDVHREMMTRFQKVKNLGTGVLKKSLISLFPPSVDAKGDDESIIIFNPSPFERNESIETHVCFHLEDIVNKKFSKLPHNYNLPFAIFDEGMEVPYEILSQKEDWDVEERPGQNPLQIWSHRFQIRMLVKNLPPTGFKVLTIKKETPKALNQIELNSGESFIENKFLRVEINQEGSILIIDKNSQEKIGPLNIFQESGDVGDEYTYSPPLEDQIFYSNKFPVKIEMKKENFKNEIILSGSMILPEHSAENRKMREAKMVEMPFISKISLKPDSYLVNFETTIDNKSSDHRVRVKFSTGLKTNTHYAHTPFSIIERETKEYSKERYAKEFPTSLSPMHKMVMIEDNKKGMALFSEGLNEYELEKDTGNLFLTLFRSVGFLDRDDLINRAGGVAGLNNHRSVLDAQCLGKRTFKYALMPFSSPWKENFGKINEHCEIFHFPPLIETRKDGEHFRKMISGIKIDPSNVILSTVKESINGEGYIIRLYNPYDRTHMVKIDLGHPCLEIFKVKLDESKELKMDLEKNSFSFETLPFAINTFLINRKPLI